MLKMTNDAAFLICRLVQDGSHRGACGLRIVVNPDTQSLSMGLAAGPDRADAVIRRDGALLFISARAAESMSTQTLCADIGGTKSAFFLTL